MSTIDVNGKIIELDKDGHLTNPGDWSETVAEYLAKESGIDKLEAIHWEIIQFVRKDYQLRGEVPTLRRMRKTGGFATNLVYELFPEGPAKKIAQIAGYAKPNGCT